VSEREPNPTDRPDTGQPHLTRPADSAPASDRAPLPDPDDLAADTERAEEGPITPSSSDDSRS
jgi:hypothetical protein